ncbi:unnamed protein product [Closterium sp. NIES-54]
MSATPASAAKDDVSVSIGDTGATSSGVTEVALPAAENKERADSAETGRGKDGGNKNGVVGSRLAAGARHGGDREGSFKQRIFGSFSSAASSDNCNHDSENGGQDADSSPEQPKMGHSHYSHRSPWLRAALLGANDGLVSTTSLMIGVGAVEEDKNTMVISGLSGLVAGACSMAIGEYISVFGQRDTEEADLRKERAEFAKGPEACARELEELALIYVERGLSYDLARTVAIELHKGDPIRAHARDELGIDMDALSSPGQVLPLTCLEDMAAIVSAIAFTIGGMIPLLSGAFISNFPTRLTVMIVVSTITFLIFGAIGAWLGGARKFRAALRTTTGGWLAMGITYAVLKIFGTAGVRLRSSSASSSSAAASPHAKRQPPEGQGKSTQKIVSGPDDVAVPTLCFNDIQVATDGFSDDAIVGGAGHTTVYRGEGPSGEPWAVKRAKRVTVSGSHLFRNEVDFLSQIKHPNIVPLLYSCDDNSEQILVFEYLANGPLSVWLRPPPGDERAALTFEQRVDAALGVGEAVQYLHSFSRPTIIHRDIKSDTILLDDHLKVKLGGLGLLKHLPGEGMRLRVARKKGYLDPEYFQTFKVTPRCDVYSFGVVMLEMLTALPPIVQGLPRSSPTAADASFAGEAPSPTPPMSLPQWSCLLHSLPPSTTLLSRTLHRPPSMRKPCSKSSPRTASFCYPTASYCYPTALQALPLIQEDRVEELVDPRMPPGYPRDSLVAFARIAAECVAPLRKDRPDMPRVTFLLAELKRPAALRSVAFARFYTGDHKAVPISHTS